MYFFFFPFLVTHAFEYDYTKIEEFNMVPIGSEDHVDTSFPNVELFVEWSDWSCCSACCCPKALCKDFVTKDCKSLNSSQTRHGEFMIRPTGEIGNDDLDQLFRENRNLMKLSKAMNISGISHLLDQSREGLAQNLGVPKNTLKVFQILDCKDHIQKMDCWELAKCLYGNSAMLPEKEVAKIEERDVCENASIYVLRNAYNILSLTPEKLYRLQIDRKINTGNILKANFTIDGEPIEKLSHIRDCAHQPKRIFQHPNGIDLIVRMSEEQLSKNPKIIAVISYQSPTRLEIVVELVSTIGGKKRELKKEEDDDWFSIILISTLALGTLILLALTLFFIW